jgi:hypothetical protein
MADGISFDFSDLNRLAADLGKVADSIEPFVKSALNVTSLKVKRAAQEKVGRRRHFRHAARAITFDVEARRGGFFSEIGYEKDKVYGSGKFKTPGNLGNILEFGAPGSRNSLTPGHELLSSLQENQADFVYGIERAEADARRKAGL